MEPVNNLFGGDAYDTPNTAPHALGDRLLLGSRWYFYWKNFGIFCRSGRLGSQGKLDIQHQCALSADNVKLVEAVGGKVHLRGLNHLRALNAQPVVIVANHMSLLETAVIHAFLRPQLDFTFVIKNSLFKVPYFGDIMRSLEAIGVDRENPRDDFKVVLAEGKERLARGKSVILFPQAHRSDVFNPEHFNTIGIKLAKAANVPVLPLALKTDFLTSGAILKDMGPVHRKHEVWFEFGEPQKVEGTGKELHEKIIAFITSRLDAWYAAEGRKRPLPLPPAPEK